MQILGKLWSALVGKCQELGSARAFRNALGIGQADSYNYRVAMNHPLYQVGTSHPDDLEAFASILGSDMRAWDQAIAWIGSDELIGTLSDGFFLVGSPEAEAVTRLAFGYRQTSRGMKHLGIGIRLPFRWEEDGNLIRTTYNKYVHGRGLTARPNWPIVDQRHGGIRSIFPRLDNRGMLLSDLLLITKVPNFLTLESYQAGRSIVSVAGSHGTGTRAIELVLKDRKLMAQIGAELTSQHQGFQMLMEVDQIKHDKKRGSRARRISVRAVAPIEFPDNAWAAARREIVRRLPCWTQEVSRVD